MSAEFLTAASPPPGHPTSAAKSGVFEGSPHPMLALECFLSSIFIVMEELNYFNLLRETGDVRQYGI